MLRSMYAGITGLKANQTKLDVVGNNIANVGTTSFKGQRIRFQDSLSQTSQNASAPGNNVGGTNPRQYGLGVQVGGVDTILSQGNMQPTGRNLDCAIDGEGYFMVSSGQLPSSNEEGIRVNPDTHEIGNGNGMEMSYTRDGAFTLDSQGNLLTSDGFRVLGYSLTEKGTKDNPSIDYTKNGLCNYINADSKNGIVASSNNLVPLRIPDSIHINATSIDANGVEMNYVGTNNTTATIGTEPNIKITGNTYKGKEDLDIQIKWDGTFNKNQGAYVVSVNGNNPVEVTDFGNAQTGLVDDNGNSLKLSQLGIDISAPAPLSPADKTVASKNSWNYKIYADGDQKIRNFSIEKDGMIKGVLADGRVSALGQIGMAAFKNPGGLMKMGRNLYSNTSNSGTPSVRSAIGTDENNDNSSAFGSCLNGQLEMSNVDLAEQFTDMIVASRAFQANGKIITTGDEILQNLVNLKR